MKTIRQVKTVFIIFIAFVCCWSPYIVVLLYDTSDSLPLPVHMYTSMLAHLHASLNFAIYGLCNRSFSARCHQCVAGLVSRCCRRMAPNNAASTALFSCDTHRIEAVLSGGVDVNRMNVVEFQQFQEIEDSHDAAAETPNTTQPPFFISIEEER